MRLIRPTRPVSAEQAHHYREAGLWDDRQLRDGIEAAAAQRPTALAVADGTQQIDHALLARLVEAGVGRLRSTGAQPGGALVLVSGNVVEGLVAYHAALRGGVTTILLDRRCGTADLRHALAIAGAEVTVVIPDAERDRLLEGQRETRALSLEAFQVVGDADSEASSWSEPDRDAPAVVLFTSGTTSRPKAVIHSLNTLTAGARNMTRITGATAETIEFLVSPLTSITGVMQMHLAADAHAAIVLEDHFDDEATLDRINTHGATLLGGAPVIAERLLRAAQSRADRRIALRTLALGGAMLPRPLLEVATREFGMDVARVYGSSESPNTTGSLPDDAPERRLLDDGALMPGTALRIGSKEHGQEGMICGPALFLGYVDPRDNEAAFEDHWYRTGDAVELADGRLTVVGRLEDVVNRNGLKVSLAEVEDALARLPGSIEAACFGLPDSNTGERLAVAVRAAPSQDIRFEAMIEHLRGQGIATRKLPEQIVLWEDPLPRTISGKVVRSRLVMESAGRTSLFAPRLLPQAPPGGPMLPTPEDHVAISDLIARYCLTLDLDDVEGWVSLFLPDARYEVYGRTWDGHAGLRKMAGAAPGGLHLGGPPVIEMTGPDGAKTTRNLCFVDRATGDARNAVYEDELTRTANGWRIAHTRCRFIVAEGLSDRP